MEGSIHDGEQRNDLIVGIISEVNYSSLEDNTFRITRLTDPVTFRWMDRIIHPDFGNFHWIIEFFFQHQVASA